MEHVVFCIDNSAWSRNGDYTTSRFDVQLDTIYDFYPVLLDSNPENTMGIISMGGNRVTVLTSLTRERYKFGTSMKTIDKKGECDLYRGLAMAQLVLKHRENAHGKARIIAFVGSPLKKDPRLSTLALLLSKDSISVDILSFGEINDNHEQLEDFINKVNIDNYSHLYEVAPNQSFKQYIMKQTAEEGFADFDDFDDVDLRRAIEESRRTYQMETAGQTQETNNEADELSELRNTLQDEDMDEEFLNDLHAAMLESLRYSNENDQADDQEKKDDAKKDNNYHDEVDYLVYS